MELKPWIQPILTGLILLLLTHVSDMLGSMHESISNFETHILVDDMRHEQCIERLMKLERE